MKKFSADKIYKGLGAPLEESILITDDNGKILSIDKMENHDPSTVQKFKGALIPGFINTHCHLELSHMKGVADTGTGLIPFINCVVTQRDFPKEEIQAAIMAAEKEMYENGIVAVGDISNVTDSFECKGKSKMKFYTFLEMFDMFQAENALGEFNKYLSVFEKLEVQNGDKKAIVPHAPYSVSESLFDLIQKATPNGNTTISIHNQETPPEMELFQKGTGGFADWYKSWNLNLDSFTVTEKNSIHYALGKLNPNNRTLFVHNTLTNEDDLKTALDWSKNTFWASCPNANLYIENRLPNYKFFIDAKAKVTLGTDSLTSNWQLSILEEMKTINRFQSYIPFETLLQWASINGAEALGFDDELGSFEVGKTPGINLLENFDGQLSDKTNVQRIM